MKIRWRRPLLVLAVAVVAVAAWQITQRGPADAGPSASNLDPAGAGSPDRSERLNPRPTEHRLDDDAERRNKAGRRRWMEQMHRTAPGIDWQAVARANGQVLQERRNQAVLIHRGSGGDKSRTTRWTELGSRNLAGRMHVAAVSVAADSLYGGSSRGGVWKGSLEGEGWRPLSDNLWGGSHHLAIAGVGTVIINTMTDGGTLRYSTDEGQTWTTPTGITGSTQQGIRLARDPADPYRVYVMVWSHADGSRLFRSTDGGANYSSVLDLAGVRGDFWLDRVVGGDLYVLAGNTLQVSTDQGESWSSVGTVPVAEPANVVLAASEAGAPTFYAAVAPENQWLLYRSTDGGQNWEYRYVVHDFWRTLCASINDPDLILFAGVEAWRSDDGGGLFQRVNGWAEYYQDPVNKLHADFPGLDCMMLGGREVWYPATDGGLYRSESFMVTVTNISLEGLGVSQYYTTLTSVNDPELILAGSQDQGYQRSTGPDRSGGWDFTQLISGDYAHLTSSDGSHERVYSVYPGFVLVQNGELNPNLAGMLDFPPDEDHGWLPYIQAHPTDQDYFYFCARHLYLARWGGGDNVRYEEASPDLTTAGGSYLSAFGFSPLDFQRRITVTNEGQVWYSNDGGQLWNLSPDPGPASHYFYGTAIVFSDDDPLRAWLGGNGYSGPAVYRTDDGGVTWIPDGERLPSTLVYELTLESPGHQVLYAASEAGPYRRDPDTGVWDYIGEGVAPLTTYWCVESVPAAQAVRFGTYGRGIWDYDVSEPTAVAQGAAPGPAAFRLGNFPNPFNPRTTVSFELAQAGPARLAVFDLAGRQVAVLTDGELAAGQHGFVWDGLDGRGQPQASGVYLARLSAGGQVASHSLVLVR